MTLPGPCWAYALRNTNEHNEPPDCRSSALPAWPQYWQQARGAVHPPELPARSKRLQDLEYCSSELNVFLKKWDARIRRKRKTKKKCLMIGYSRDNTRHLEKSFCGQQHDSNLSPLTNPPRAQKLTNSCKSANIGKSSLLHLWLHQDGTQHCDVSLANATHQKGNSLRQLPHLPPPLILHRFPLQSTVSLNRLETL